MVRIDGTGGSGDARGESAFATWHVGYGADLAAFLEALRGEVEEIDAAGSGSFFARVPLRFPDFPSNGFDLFAERYSWRSIPGQMIAAAEVEEPDPEDPDPDPPEGPVAPGPPGTGWNATHSIAEVRVEFRRPDFPFSEGSVFLSRRNRIGARVVTVPGAPYRFALTASLPARGLPINQDIGIVVPTQEIRLTRHWVPDLAAIEDAVMHLVYHTNDAPMTIGGRTWAPGCVLFAGFDSDMSLAGFGAAVSSRADYSVLVDAAGWDKVMSDVTAKFEPVTPIIYPRANLGVLLTL